MPHSCIYIHLSLSLFPSEVLDRSIAALTNLVHLRLGYNEVPQAIFVLYIYIYISIGYGTGFLLLTHIHTRFLFRFQRSPTRLPHSSISRN